LEKLKNRLIRMILEEDDQKKDILYLSLIQKLQRNIVPMIKKPLWSRKQKTKKGKGQSIYKGETHLFIRDFVYTNNIEA
jgi:hypothetical protein